MIASDSISEGPVVGRCKKKVPSQVNILTLVMVVLLTVYDLVKVTLLLKMLIIIIIS